MFNKVLVRWSLKTFPPVQHYFSEGNKVIVMSLHRGLGNKKTTSFQNSFKTAFQSVSKSRGDVSIYRYICLVLIFFSIIKILNISRLKFTEQCYSLNIKKTHQELQCWLGG